MVDSAGRLQLGLLMRTGELRSPGGDRRIGWAELREIAQLAEAVGVDSLFLADHFLFRNSGGVVMPEGESRGVWEAMTILSALAEATSRVTLGPLVACTTFRNPALLAKMADTLDEISGGRLVLGLGAGWHKPEYDAFGYPFDHRAGRFEEAIAIIIPLLREGHVDFQGMYYQARDCELRPRGPHPNGPPIWIGARQPRMMRLAARYADVYNTVWYGSPAPLARQLAAFEATCREVGRDPSSIGRTSGTFIALPGPDVHPSGEPHQTISGSPAEIAAQLEALHAAGAQHVTCALDPWNVRAIERFGEVIQVLRKLEKNR